MKAAEQQKDSRPGQCGPGPLLKRLYNQSPKCRNILDFILQITYKSTINVPLIWRESTRWIGKEVSMKKSLISFVFVAVVLLGMLSISSPAAAQSNWLYPTTGQSVSLEAYRLSFHGLHSFLSMTWFLSAKTSTSFKGVSAVMEWPFTNWDWDGDSKAQNFFGNPYIGIEYATRGSSPVGGGGIRFPVAPDDKCTAYEFAAATCFDRIEAFMPDVFTIYASGGYRYVFDEYHSIQLLGGPVIMNWTEGGVDSELFFDYKGEYWARTDILSFGVGFTGRILLTESDLDFDERTWHQLGFASSVAFGQFRPGFHMRIPLDEELKDFSDVIYGLNFSVEVP
jgi:hypothetical protein